MALKCDPDENPEEHAGEVIPDPWDDPAQTDWPMAKEEAKTDGDSLGDDTGN